MEKAIEVMGLIENLIKIMESLIVILLMEELFEINRLPTENLIKIRLN